MSENIEEPFIKPFFCRAGNKYVLRNEIIPLIPEHDIYVEPFFGSGAIFFSKQKALINIINDLDDKTINNIKLLIRSPSDLTKYKQDIDTTEKAKAFFNRKPKSDADKLIIEKIRACNGFNNREVRTDKDIYKGINPFSTIKNIDLYKKKLEGVHIFNLDYRKIIKKFDTPSTFFFLDPPYENTDPKWGYAEDKDTFDFNELKKTLKKIKGKFLMTINDSPAMRELFKDFNVKPFTAFTNSLILGKERKELFISNYPI